LVRPPTQFKEFNLTSNGYTQKLLHDFIQKSSTAATQLCEPASVSIRNNSDKF